MIKLEVIDNHRDQFVVRGDEPYRVEIVGSDPLIAHVYRGEEINKDQQPVGVYDGTLEENKSWKAGAIKN